MTAVPILVADAVTSVINAAASAGDFAPLEFTAERRYADWDDEVQELGELTVDVVFTSHQSSGGGTIELDSASTLQYQPKVDVVVRKKFDDRDRDTNRRLKSSSIDPLVGLLQNLHELFVADRNEGFTVAGHGIGASWNDGEVMSWVNQWKLRQAGMFEGVVRINFMAQREVA